MWEIPKIVGSPYLLSKFERKFAKIGWKNCEIGWLTEERVPIPPRAVRVEFTSPGDVYGQLFPAPCPCSAGPAPIGESVGRSGRLSRDAANFTGLVLGCIETKIP